jgi:hypothetical protein
MEISMKDLKDLLELKKESDSEAITLDELNIATEHFFKIGANYLIRTVTMIYTGKLESVGEKELVLSNCAWIADTGRFSENLISCSFNEVEMYPAKREVIIGRGALLDAVIIDKLPTETK